jgi:O-antigen/teichoic acid export membrane protein
MSDRLVLAPLVPAADLGLYSVAYQFAMPIAILSAATSQAVMPHFARASVDTAGMHSLRPVATTQAIVIAFFGVAAALVCPSLIAVLLPVSFAAAATLVPLIVLGYVFFGWYLVPMNVLSLVVGKTRWVWTATGIAALSNVVLNLLLVPRLGVIAAALNTALAYGVLLLLVYVHARRELAQSIPIDWRSLAGALGILAVAYVTAATLTSPGDLIGLVSRSIILLATGATLVLYAARFGITHSVVARET